MIKRRLLNSLTAAALLAVPVAVSVPSAGIAQINEVIVTARKREESRQDIPVAVTAFGDLQIERGAIRSIDDVADLTPSLQFDQGFWPSDTRVSIRGLFARAGRPSAAVLVDGIDAMSEALESAGGSSMLNTRLLDIERIEVVKGPQSALYGRGAFAGAINYVTRRPDMEEWGGFGSVDIAEYGRYEARGAITGPVVEDKLAIRLNAASYGFDGFYNNQATGQEVGGGESNGFGASFLLTPNEDFSLYTNVMYSDDEYDAPAIATITANSVLGPIPGDTSPRVLNAVTGTITANESLISQEPDPRTGGNYPGTGDEMLRVNVVAEWDLGWGTVKSLTGYVDNEHTIQMDTTQQAGGGVGIGGSFTDANYLQEFEQWSQELQLLSNNDGRWNWMIGAQGFWEDATDINNSRFWLRDPTSFFCGLGAICSFADADPAGKIIERETTSYSVFGLVGWDITDQLNLTVEARYIYDEVEIATNKANSVTEGLQGAPGPILPGVTDSVDDSNFLPRVSLDFDVTDDVMLYASVAKGIKPPTFNLADIGADPTIKRVATEELLSYEIGAKTAWADNTIILNGAVFYHDYEDQQVLVQFPPADGGFLPQSGTTNAGKVEVWGAELEALWQPTDNWSFSAGYTYIESEYEDFNLLESQVEGVPVSSSNILKSGNLEGDFSGNDTPGVPDHAFTFSGQFEQELANGMGWFANLSGRYQGERQADAANLVTLDDYWIFDAQLGITGENWSVIGYVENLADDDTVQYAQEFIDQKAGLCLACGFTFPVAYYAYLPPPRVFGIRTKIDF